MKEVTIIIGVLLLFTAIEGISQKIIEPFPEPFWEGDVTLVKNTTFVVTAHNSGKTYKLSSTTALGALDRASKEGNFDYTVNDKWYKQYGSLFVDSIAGKKNEGVNGWQYWVNYPDEPLPWIGADKYQLKDGDTVDWFYGGYGKNPDTASMLIRIHVHIVTDITPPSIEFTEPRGGLYIFDREIIHFPGISYIIGKITIKADVTDDLSGVKEVKFYIDDELKEVDEKEPYSWKWNETAIGSHIIKAIAYDMVGNYNVAQSNVWILSI
ncbi:MAG: DUF4430 domain-containing protein [Thermoplasmata archaeon]|nr:MAG: DUF4430 domain-containing protein [Thermoplasmata archaeon]